MPITERDRWRREVSRAPFPAGARQVKGTLLALVPLMTTDGRLARWQSELIDATGLPGRTLRRHLELAVTHGWLAPVTRGGNGRSAVYDGTVPGQVVGHTRPTTPESCRPPTRPQLGEVVGRLVADSNKECERRRERVAVDPNGPTHGTTTEHAPSPLPAAALAVAKDLSAPRPPRGSAKVINARLGNGSHDLRVIEDSAGHFTADDEANPTPAPGHRDAGPVALPTRHTDDDEDNS
jgi:hypothetical protein